MLLNKVLAVAAKQLIARDQWDDNGEDDDNCVKAVPGKNGHVPITACNSYYNYDPQFAPAVAVAAIFGIFTLIHIVQSITFRKKYAWVLIMGALWETLGFTFHSLGTKDQQQIGYATAWNILFLLAPLWINAFVYMTFARMLHYWQPDSKIIGIRARGISKWFVFGDIISFIIQGVGGILASPTASPDIIKIGLNLYLGGLGLQLAFIVFFCFLMFSFQRAGGHMRGGYIAHSQAENRSWKPLLFALYGVLVCIIIRVIFRIAEFARGVTPDNPIPFHEEYTYALDCFPMMVALLILAIYHPGRFLVGPDSEFPRKSRKHKKAEKAERKEAERFAREEKKARRSARRGT